jgi:DNA end-binding protein Ku
MARSIWKGSLSFGLVSIPVALYPADKPEELSFHQLDRRDLGPVGYKRINKKTEKEVPWGQIVRGYEYQRGSYVVLTDQDLKRANVESTQSIDIAGFVPADQISPLYYERPYYLEPGKGGNKAYALLRDTLKRSGMAGIASVVIRTRQHLAAVLERNGVLVLETLRWSHEIRDTKDLEVPDEKHSQVSKKEAEMALQLVKGMVEKWDPGKYKDTYADDLMALIRRKVSSGKTTEVDESEPAKAKRGVVVDLMPLLKKSLEQKRGGTRRRPKEASGSVRREAQPRRRQAH